MSITYRNLKGAPLSAEELDQNFRELYERLENLENSIPRQNLGGISQISQEGSEVLFENTQGETMGRLSLPSLKLRPRGRWSPQTDYAYYDMCLLEGESYLCKRAHKSGDVFVDQGDQGDQGDQWDLIFSTNA